MRSAFVVAGGAATAFVCLLALVVVEWSPLMEFDVDTVARATDVTREHNSYRDALQVLTTVLNSGWTVLAVGLISIVVWLGRRAGTALWLFGVVGIGNLVGPTLKRIVDRQRPDLPEPIQSFTGLSFPSGHAGSATLAAGALLLVVWGHLGPGERIVAVCAAAALPLISAWTRLALGGHYPSDLIGGFLLGTAWVAAWSPLLPRLAERFDQRADELTPSQGGSGAT